MLFNPLRRGAFFCFLFTTVILWQHIIFFFECSNKGMTVWETAVDCDSINVFICNRKF